MKLNENTKKLFRLQSSEKYKVKRLNETSFEVYTRNLRFRAFVDILGIIIYKNNENYDKKEFHKLKNYCNLLQREHLICR